MIRMTSAAVTDVGRIRHNNEDNFYLCGIFKEHTEDNEKTAGDNSQRGSYLYAVCDGMGGEQFGEEASLIAVKTLREYNDNFSSDLEGYISAANDKICAEITKNGGVRMGTTLAILWTEDSRAMVCNVGDSRVYMLRGGELTQLSKDHTQIQRLINQGLLNPEDADNHPDRHRLTQHLGIFPSEMIIEPYCDSSITVQAGDAFLICSDGLTDMLDDAHICELLQKDGSPAETAQSLVAAALEKGGRDNITALVALADEVEEPVSRGAKLKNTMKKIKDWLNEDAFSD